MRVTIDEIKESGLRRSWDVPRDQVDGIVSGDRAGYRARSPLHLEARLERLERRIRVEGHARAELTAPCGRCLAPVAVDVPVDFDLTLVPSGEHAAGEEAGRAHDRGPVGGSFRGDAVDEDVYDGKVVELDPILREQLLLALPGYPVCGEGCKGLCPVCGNNLNERACGCDTRVPDPRWAGLEKLKRQ